MTLYTSKVIAQWLCLTERRVRQLRDEGVIVEARPGLYELQPTVARYIKYLGGAGKESLNTERMKLTAEKRKAAEMDNDLRRGDLHSTQDIEKGIQTMCLNIRSRFLAMPAPQIDAEFLGLTPEDAEKLQAQIVREFALWADTPVCDADRVDNFYKLQQLTFLSYAMNGDAIVLLPTKEQTGQPYSLRVRLVEADRVCSPDGFDRLVPCTVQGHDVHCIVQGVETDADGMVVAYWVCDRHPLASNAYTSGGPHWTRVEAYTKTTGRRNVLHVMNRERAGQRRGVPMLAPVLEALKQLGRYTDAEITAAVLSAMFTVFVKQGVASDARPFGEMLPPDMLIDAQDQSSIELGPGAILSLNPGEDVEFADPKHPNTGYDAFTNALIRQIGAALEIPPEVLFKQFTTSYSAARGALNEFWRTCSMQRDWFTDDFCQPIYEEWFAEAVARGRIAAPGFFADPAIRKAYTACAWNGPARTNLNPVQEVDAAVKRVDAGFSTAQEETATMTGGDYNRNIRQRVIEAKRKREVDEITNPQAKPPGGQQEE